MPDQTMRAVRYHDYGGPEVLVVEKALRPSPKPGEVLVRVHAAGVNPVDWKIRKGFMKAAAPLQFPHTPGFDLAGDVEAVGEGVTGFRKGQAGSPRRRRNNTERGPRWCRQRRQPSFFSRFLA